MHIAYDGQCEGSMAVGGIGHHDRLRSRHGKVQLKVRPERDLDETGAVGQERAVRGHSRCPERRAGLEARVARRRHCLPGGEDGVFGRGPPWPPEHRQPDALPVRDGSTLSPHTSMTPAPVLMTICSLSIGRSMPERDFRSVGLTPEPNTRT
jgi:hypothetical protein